MKSGKLKSKTCLVALSDSQSVYPLFLKESEQLTHWQKRLKKKTSVQRPSWTFAIVIWAHVPEMSCKDLVSNKTVKLSTSFNKSPRKITTFDGHLIWDLQNHAPWHPSNYHWYWWSWVKVEYALAEPAWAFLVWAIPTRCFFCCTFFFQGYMGVF